MLAKPDLAATEESFKFLFLSAFTSNPDCGNPAVVIFLPQPCIPSPSTPVVYPKEKLQAIAKNLHQPMAAFVSPLPSTDVDADYAIRWFTSEVEVPMCGHAALAASKAIAAAPELAAIAKGKASKEVGPPEDGLLRFLTIGNAIITSRVISVPSSHSQAPIEHIQLSFPHAPPQEINLNSPEGIRILAALSKALQKPAGEIDVRFLGHGGEGTFETYLLVELGEGEVLEGREVVSDAFVSILSYLDYVWRLML